jgi:hypothetical protein
MKRFALLMASLAVAASSTGCCCMYPWGGGCAGGACGYGPYAPYGGSGVVAPTSAYYPATTIQAAVPVPGGYALAPAYPVTAAVPMEILPTY